MSSVSRSLDASMRRALGIALSLWQLFAIWAALNTEPTQPRWRLVLAHAVAAVLTLLLLRGRSYILPVFFGLYLLWTYDFYSAPKIDGALCLSACWLGNMLHISVLFLVPRRIASAVPVAAAVLSGLCLQYVDGVWRPDVTAANVVTAVAIVVICWFALPRVWRLAVDADRSVEREARERYATVQTQRAARKGAEDARLLHDTVINTLGAVANGGAGVADVELVRERCRNDIATLSALLEDRAPVSPDSLADLGGAFGRLTVVRTGLDDQRIREVETQVVDEVARALNAATRELVRNVDKHAGVGMVEVRVELTDADALSVTVADEGAGFAGEVLQGHGLAESVLARIAAVGGRVEIDTAPGSGTRVTIVQPTGTAAEMPEQGSGHDADATDERMMRMLAGIRYAACWLWAAGSSAVGVVIEAINRPGVFSATYTMLALVVAASALAWWATRARAYLSGWVAVLLCLSVPPAFLLGIASTDFGGGDVLHYQAWGMTPLLVILATYGRGRMWFVVGLALLALTALTTAIVVGGSSRADSAVIVVGAAPAFVPALGWRGFNRLVERLARAAEASRRAVERLALVAAAQEAAGHVRARWQAAELHTSLDLLEGLADGSLVPTQPGVQARCGRQEAYLRQLIQLSPDAFRMGVPLARALAVAHARSVTLVVRTGSVDAPDALTARLLGRLVLAAVGLAREGDRLTVGLFAGRDGRQLTIVGDSPEIASKISQSVPTGEGWSISTEFIDGQRIVEICWPDNGVEDDSAALLRS